MKFISCFKTKKTPKKRVLVLFLFIIFVTTGIFTLPSPTRAIEGSDIINPGLLLGPAGAATYAAVKGGGSNLASSAAANVALWIGNFLATLAGYVMAFEAWILEVVLTINSNIVNAPIVQAGFPITLAFANMALVVGIIVMAIFTILRQETYGMKALLWKIVVMAVVINFGLVIAGTILKFGDDTTQYFLNQTVSEGGFGRFVSGMISPYNPQQALIDTGKGDGLSDKDKEKLQTAFTSSNFGASAAAIITPLIGLVQVIWLFVLMIIILAVLIVMLLVRYVTLGFLLLFLPFAWVAWVFPSLSKHWSDWWDKFLKQVFFAPIVVFMLALGIKVGEALNNNSEGIGQVITQLKARQDGPFAAIGAFLTGAFAPIIIQGLNGIILSGIFMGGIIVAQKFGIAFADGVKKAAGTTKNWATGAVTRGVRRGGTAPLRGERMRKRADEWLDSKNFAVRVAGRTLKTVQRAGEKPLKDLQEKYSKYSPQERLEALATAVDPQTKVALLEQIQKDGNTNRVTNLEEHLDSTAFTRLGKNEALEKIKDDSGITLRDTARNIDDLKLKIESERNEEKLKALKQELELNETKFEKKLRKLDAKITAQLFTEKGFKNISVNKDKDELARLRAKAVMNYAQLPPNYFIKLVENFESKEQDKIFTTAAKEAGVTYDSIGNQMKNYLKKNPGAISGANFSLFGIEESDVEETSAPALFDASGNPITPPRP